MLYTVILFLLLIALTFRPDFGGENIKFNKLSLQNTLVLRGVLAIVIVLNHLVTVSGLSYSIEKPFLLPQMGYLSVAVFFFLSGFGLQSQMNQKGAVYLSKIGKRSIWLLSIYVLINVLYAVCSPLFDSNKTNESIQELAYRLIDGHPVAGTSWYLANILVLYTSFFFAKKFRHSLLALFILQFFIFIIYNLVGYGSIWMLSNLAFPVGVLFAETHTQSWINGLTKPRFRTNILILIIVSCFLLLISTQIEKEFLRVFTKALSTALFPVFLIWIFTNVKCVFPIWSKVGVYSLEIFLLHVGVFQILRGGRIYVNNELIYIALTFILTFLLSYPFHILNSWIRSLVNKI